jgi:hypothetical protein
LSVVSCYWSVAGLAFGTKRAVHILKPYVVKATLMFRTSRFPKSFCACAAALHGVKRVVSNCLPEETTKRQQRTIDN